MPQISRPLLGTDPLKTCYDFYQYPKYRSHPWDTSHNTSSHHTFSKHQTSPTDLPTDPEVYEHSTDIYHRCRDYFCVRNRNEHRKNISPYKITTFYEDHFRINLIHKKNPKTFVCMLPKILPKHEFCNDKLTNFYVPSFLSLLFFFFPTWFTHL